MLSTRRGQLGQPRDDRLRTRTLSGLQQVPDAGGTPQPLTRLEKGEISHRWPEFLPGGKAVLFAAVDCGSLSQRAGRRPVARDRRTAEPGPRGDEPPLRALRAPGLCARGKLDGRAVRSPAAGGHGRGDSRGRGRPAIPVSGAAQYSFSATGSLVYVPGAFSAPKAGWCGSVAMGQSSPWPPLRTPTRRRGFPPTDGE